MKKLISILLLLTQVSTAFAGNSTFIQGPTLIESLSTTATAGGTTTLTMLSNTNQNFSGTLNQTVVLPDATTLKVGRRFNITNSSSGVLTVRDAFPTTLFTLDGGDFASVVLVSNSTAAGVWSEAVGVEPLGFVPEDSANKSNDGTFAANSSTLYPTQQAAKTYADTKVAKAGDTMTGALTMNELATPATPASGKAMIYPKADGNWYQLDDTGLETVLAGGGGGGGGSGSGATFYWSGFHDADCYFDRTNAALGDPNADATCTFTERENQGFGAVTSYLSGSDKLPGFVFTPPETGAYWACSYVTNHSGNDGTDLDFKFWDGTTTIAEAVESNQGGTINAHNLTTLCGLWVADDLTPKTLSLQTAASGGAVSEISGSALGTAAVQWSIFKLGAASGSGNVWNGYHACDYSWSSTSTSYVTATNGAVGTFAERENRGFGTVTTAASDVAGITFTPSHVDAVYFVQVNASAYNNTAGNAALLKLTDGTVEIGKSATQNAGSGTNQTVPISGIYMPGVTTPVTLEVELATAVGGATSFLGACYSAGSGIEWTIIELNAVTGTLQKAIAEDQTPTSSISNVASNVVFGTVSPNTGTAYNTTTGTYTVPEDGTYLYTARIAVGGSAVTANNVGASLTLEHNGTPVAGNAAPTFATGIGYVVELSHAVEAEQGDTLDLLARSDLGTPTYSVFIDNSSMSIVKIAPSGASSGGNTLLYTIDGPNSSTIQGNVSTNTAAGQYAHVEGTSNIASGAKSHAEGTNTEASGASSHAEGEDTTATGQRSHAEGFSSDATAINAHAEGDRTLASGDDSHAEGQLTEASGLQAHAEGEGTEASGSRSHAEGLFTVASNAQAHAQGSSTNAIGGNTHAAGSGTTSEGTNSAAWGQGTYAQAFNSFVIGRYNIVQGTVASYAAGDDAFVIGNGTGIGSEANAFSVSNDGTVKLYGKILNDEGGAADTSGLATLVAGTVTINTTAVTANSHILVTVKTPGGGRGHLDTGTRSAGTSFTITSTDNTETSTVSWFIVEPN